MGDRSIIADIIIPKAPQQARFDIDIFKWRENKGPVAWSELAYDEDALKIRLYAYESPLIVRAYEDGAEVWKDSCLEFFVRPEQDARYLNFEVNPLGNMIIALGADRYNRVSMLEIKPRLNLTVTIHAAYESSADNAVKYNAETNHTDKNLWEVSYSIPFAMLDEIYGCKTGPRYYCNFYKCGGADDHLGMWREVNTETPDFHQPDSFGSIIMAE